MAKTRIERANGLEVVSIEVDSDTDLPRIITLDVTDPINLFMQVMEFFNQVSGRRTLELGSAHYNFNPAPFVPDEIKSRLSDAAMKVRGDNCRYVSDNTPESVFREMLQKETSLNLGNFKLIPSCGNSTRESIYNVLIHVSKPKSGLRKQGKPIALSIPNWHFWGLGQRDPFVYYDAQNEDELIEGFNKLAVKKKISGILLVDPANPLLYELTPEAAREIDRIALKHGLDIIVDDVLRGTKPIGKRDTIARHFTQPYVIEGFSKRFGDDIGSYSYVLAPKKSKYSVEQPPSNFNFLMGDIMKAFGFIERPAIDELEARNRAFDSGLIASDSGLRVIRPFPTSLISLIELPQDSKLNADEFTKKMYDAEHVSTNPLSHNHVFYPGAYQEKPGLERLFRITVGRHNQETLKRAGYLIGNYYKQAQNGTSNHSQTA